jgi:hypothetical protein
LKVTVLCFRRRKKEEGRRKKEEGRRKKEEGRRKKEEGRRKKEFTRYQALPGNADPEALPPLIWQLTGERTVGGV